jgi:ABC-2 type transport system permease protein
MKNLILIAKREYLATVRTKGFLIGLIVAPILMGGSAIGMALFQGKVDTTDRNILIVDHTGVVADHLVQEGISYNENDIFDKEGNQNRPKYLFEVMREIPEDLPQMRLELSNSVRNGTYFGFIEIGRAIMDAEPPDNLEGKVALYSRNPTLDTMRGWINERLNSKVRNLHLLELGIDPNAIGDIFRWHSIEGMELVEADETGKALDAKKVNEAATILVPMIMLILMFMLVMMGAMPLLNTVMEEKNQHIAETILSSASPFEFMFGKVVGGVAVALTGSFVYIAGACIALFSMGAFGFIPVGLIPWFIIYLIIANLMLGSIMSSIGSACTDLRESQNLTVPAMLPLMIPMFVMFPIIEEPTSGFATFMSLIPPFTPMLMILRQGMPEGVPLWQSITGLVGSGLFTLFTIWVASRVFRVAILLKGKTPSFGTLAKWAIKG